MIGTMIRDEGGRIKLYCTEKRDYLWTCTINDLQSLEAPLSATDQHGYYCWGGGKLTGINIENGEQLWEKQMPSTTKYPVLESYGAVFVAITTLATDTVADAVFLGGALLIGAFFSAPAGVTLLFPHLKHVALAGKHLVAAHPVQVQ